MSVQYETIIIVGITEERFFELFPTLNQSFFDENKNEEFIDEFCIHANYWCKGQHFIGLYVSELKGGEFVTIENLVDNFYIEDKKQNLLDALAKFNFYISIDEIKTFIINQIS